MKFFFNLLIGALLMACSSETVLDEPPTETTNDIVDNHRVSQTEAVEIACDFMKSLDLSQERLYSLPEVSFVVDEKRSRGVSVLPDTLAYVINYPDNKGFVIVCADTKGKSILAFSETGTFSFENEIVMESFVSNIKPYVEKRDTMGIDTGLQLEMGFKQVEPKIKTILDQRSPFDKYVIEEHPGCPVGCVAVGTALIMSHCEAEVEFNGHKYCFPSIVEAIYNKQQPFDRKLRTNGLYPSISYEDAIDQMALLLNEIGKEIDMSYTLDASWANTSTAANLLRNLGYEFSSETAMYVQGYDEMTEYIIDDNILLTSGSLHCWVIDGVYYKFKFRKLS
ncbi:MAG: Spi family protease inhibitor [Muribaculaceae bacterium]|nr:Spi family protease inhibitor [Muribaculaceae bacterium]